MSKSSQQDTQTPTKISQRLRLMLLSRGSIAVGSLLLILIIAGVWWLRNFVKTELAPLAQKNLTNTLNRPVELGEVQEFSLTGVKFAASAIPPTSTDTDQVKIESVNVGFNPWQLVTNRQLKLDVTLINPDIYIQQDSQDQWVTTKIAEPGEPGIIKTDLDIIRVRNAKLVLVGNPPKPNNIKNNSNLSNSQTPTPVVFSGLYGKAQLVKNSEDQQSIKFDVSGKPDNGGNIVLAGNILLENIQQGLDGNLKVRTQNLLAADITNLIPLPVNLTAGRFQGDLDVQLIPTQPPLLNGNADLENVTIQIPEVPQDFSNTQGKIAFQGLALDLKNVVSSYGKIPLTAKGIIDREKGFNLTANVNAVSVSHALETLKVNTPFPVNGVVKADLQLSGDINNPVLSGQVNNIKPAKIDKVDIAQVSSKFSLSTRDSLLTLTDIQGKTTVGGEVKGVGKISLGKSPQIDVNLTAQNVPGDKIAKLYNEQINENIKIGTVTATANINGAADNVQTFVKWQAPQATYPTTGETIVNSDRTVNFRNVAVNVAGNIIRGYGSYNPRKWQAVANVDGVEITPFLNPEQRENFSLENAKFDGQVTVSGTSDKFQITNISSQNAGINLGGGRVNLARLQLEDNNFVADLVANNIRLSRILKQSPAILNNPITGKFTIAGNTENFDLQTLGGVGEGSLQVGKGKITATNIKLGQGNYQALVTVDNVSVQRLADVPNQFQGRLVGQFNVAGSVESFSPENILAAGKAKLNIAGGTVTASDIQVANGNYQALVSGSGVQLNRLNQQLQGQFAGELKVAGILGSAKLADLRATGEVQLSRGLPGINSPLNAAISWDGQQLTIPQARTRNINTSGYIVANAQQPGIPEITQVNLNVQAQDYDLKQLPLQLPNGVSVAGTADFQGQISGKPTSPNVVGTVGVKNLQVQKFAFEELLTGKINLVSGNGLSIDIAGKEDRIAAQLNANNRPQAFALKWQQASAVGQAKGNIWDVKVNNFPLQALNFNVPSPQILGEGVVIGLLSGDVEFNQKTLATQGNIAIAKPQLGRIKGDNFTTEFNYVNKTAYIRNAKFTINDSNYLFDADVKQTDQAPEIQANVKLEKAKIQDLLQVAQIFDIQDLQRGLTPPTYGTATDLNTNSQGLPEQPLLNQIQRLSEIDALLAAQEQKRIESNPIPNLTDLHGILNGEIAFNTATKDGLAASFNIQGQQFTWGREEEPTRFYRAEKLTARGSFEKGILRLQPFSLEAKDRLIALTGNIGGDKQSGKLTVRNFPIQLLNNFVRLPVGISGNLNVNAGLTGSIANPQARGELDITEGQLNQKPITSATAGFSYADGRLRFGSKFAALGSEPVDITGNIPYKLPFASVEPDNNSIELDVKVKNESLGLLNILTNQIAFEDGEGEIDITVRGTREKPLVKGIANLNNATFVAQALPGKLTNVSGEAEFDFDKVLVENLQAKFSDGKIEAQGEIPIFKSQSIQIENPLDVKLDKLVLNLKGLYQGGASGDLDITGSVLQPAIGGNILLSNGQVLIADSSASALSENDSESLFFAANKQNKIPNVDSGIVRLNNLIIKLGNNVEIASPPVFNFQANGELNVTGSLDDPIPAGTIRLTRGGVNLFTTQFKLARSYEHTATFRRSQPRDPDLDVRLVAKVLDGVQTTNLSRQLTTGLSELETVRVEATVRGSARQLDRNLELRSSPSRSQTEIITLLGGGFLDTQGRGDSTLGLINIAGSAVFNNFQGAFNQIGNAFGLSELRIFPTILSDNPDAGESTSTIELALEAGVDIANIFSFSTIKILTASDPFQWGINYRITEEIRIRASTNLEDDSRTVIEFERRF
jgi:translocation and assembly module TamB